MTKTRSHSHPPYHEMIVEALHETSSSNHGATLVSIKNKIIQMYDLKNDPTSIYRHVKDVVKNNPNDFPESHVRRGSTVPRYRLSKELFKASNVKNVSESEESADETVVHEEDELEESQPTKKKAKKA